MAERAVQLIRERLIGDDESFRNCRGSGRGGRRHHKRALEREESRGALADVLRDLREHLGGHPLSDLHKQVDALDEHSLPLGTVVIVERVVVEELEFHLIRSKLDLPEDVGGDRLKGDLVFRERDGRSGCRLIAAEHEFENRGEHAETGAHVRQ